MRREIEMVSILIAPWGNPANWSEIRYKYNSEEVVSHTSLDIVAKIHNPRYMVVIGSDTISIQSEELFSGGSVEYKDVIKYAEEYLRRKLEEWGIYKRYNIDISILPGKGGFRKIPREEEVKGIFEGAMTDFKYSLTYSISDLIINHLRNNSENEVNIVLDLSHGINFMPALTYSVALKLARLLRFKYSKVGFTVVNSDPYLKGYKGPYMINELVSIENISREYHFEKLNKNRRFLKLSKKYKDINIENNDKIKKLGRRIGELNYDTDKLNIFLGSIVNGLPLVLLTYIPESLGIHDVLERAVDLYIGETNVEIDPSKKRLSVFHNVEFTKNFEIASIVRYLVESLDFITGDGKYDLEYVQNIAKRIYGGVGGNRSFEDRNKYIISNEIHALEECCKEYVKESKASGHEDIRYVDCMGGDESGYSIGDEGNFRRNFLSHAGLEKNITHIEIDYRDMTGDYENLRKYIRIYYKLDEYIEITDKKGKLLKKRRSRDFIKDASTIGLIQSRI